MEPPEITLPPKFAGRLTASIDETAELLGVGRTTVYAMIDNEELQRVKVGRRSLISLASIVARLQ
jgi:excisionase family DNA binding protein